MKDLFGFSTIYKNLSIYLPPALPPHIPGQLKARLPFQVASKSLVVEGQVLYRVCEG